MIEDVYKKRTKCSVFTDEIPDFDMVKNLMEKTHALVASKQNLMPYKIHVLGPDCKKYKEELYKLTVNAVDKKWTKTKANRQVFAPYVLIFTARLASPNISVQKKIEEGHSYQACFPETYLNSGALHTACIEVGMWSKIFTGLCLENNIDVGYTKCFRSWSKSNNVKWPTLPFVQDPPLFIMSVAYHDIRYRSFNPEEIKPDFDEVVCFEHE